MGLAERYSYIGSIVHHLQVDMNISEWVLLRILRAVVSVAELRVQLIFARSAARAKPEEAWDRSYRIGAEILAGN